MAKIAVSLCVDCKSPTEVAGATDTAHDALLRTQMRDSF